MTGVWTFLAIMALLPLLSAASDTTYYTRRGEPCEGPCTVLEYGASIGVCVTKNNVDLCSRRSRYTVTGVDCRSRCTKNNEFYTCKTDDTQSQYCSPVGHCMTFFSQKHYEGEKLRLCSLDYECVTLPDEWQGKANSLNTTAVNEFYVHDEPDCSSGIFARFYGSDIADFGDDLTKLRDYNGNAWSNRTRAFRGH